MSSKIENFNLSKIKTLSPIDAKEYITKYFVQGRSVDKIWLYLVKGLGLFVQSLNKKEIIGV